jgi:virulence-associated protein VapD
MFAIAFDLFVSETELHHPKGVSQAYRDIGVALSSFGSERVQGSVYVSRSDDLANLFSAIMALKALPWFPAACATSVPSGSSTGRISLRSSKAERWKNSPP